MDARDYEDAYQRDDKPREVKSNRAWRLECESLRQQLASILKTNEELRLKAVIADMPMSEVEERLRQQLVDCQRESESFHMDYRMKYDAETKVLHEQLATVTKERDELVEALKQFAECDLNDGNCASLEVATRRIRSLAQAALAKLSADKG